MRRRKAIAAPTYEAAFLAFWDASDKAGSKNSAQEAWIQVSRPDPFVLIRSRIAWLGWWNGIGVTHISTWLRAYDWQQTPEPRQQALRRISPREDQNAQAAAAFLALGKGGDQ